MAVKHCTGKNGSGGGNCGHQHSSVARQSRNADYQQSQAVQDVMQSGGNGVGTVSARSSLPPNQFSAPADPLALVTQMDARAAGYLTTASITTFLESMMFDQDMHNDSTSGYQSYLNRFGLPEQVGARFRNRFDGTRHATSELAQARELESLSTRYENLGTYLDAGVRYVSNDAARIDIGNCRDSCAANPGWGAWSCAAGGGRSMALCPAFWTTMSDGERATAIIHELVHMRYHFANHNFSNERQRGRNPECYASFLADFFGFASNYSGQCPPV
jgi:hypothetical protein